LSLIACAQGQNDQAGSLNPSMKCGVSADDRALREIPERWRAAYNDGKAEQVAELYSEDAYYLTQHFFTGILHGREEIQAYVRRGLMRIIKSTQSRYLEPSVRSTSRTPSRAINRTTPAETILE
jgi:uncharacterized protein (TIGR02246 family)